MTAAPSMVNVFSICEIRPGSNSRREPQSQTAPLTCTTLQFEFHTTNMEASALTIRLISCSVFLRIEPNKLQFFEYDSVLFHCEDFSGSTGLRTIHNSKGKILSCDTTSAFKSTVTSCNVSNLYPEDSGEVWCESAKKEKSNSFNITVTAGSVILESPALPVKEGEAVTLRCRNKMTPSNSSADFYKNGLLIGSSSTGQMIIPRVLTYDRGRYKCKLSGGGESAESWLAVEARPKEKEQPSDLLFIILRNLLPVVMVILLMVMLGLLHCCKHRDKQQQLRSTFTEMEE
ncbi:low affinity immunoglobulin gamma Fc region receptor II-like [Halichoeres trimaculatus]|uniref:low affinity immunoglobulin gamma Fc region receptor II-like n=1 Tax=Halichoeres trimaculatus TaxID=147232 RepID=UPI003D9E7867